MRLENLNLLQKNSSFKMKNESEHIQDNIWYRLREEVLKHDKQTINIIKLKFCTLKSFKKNCLFLNPNSKNITKTFILLLSQLSYCCSFIEINIFWITKITKHSLNKLDTPIKTNCKKNMMRKKTRKALRKKKTLFFA